MALLRHLTLALLLALPAVASAEPARDVPAMPETVTGARTVLHFTTTGADAITLAEGARLAALADAAVPVGFEGSGFPAPPDDGDGRIDLYVHEPETRFASGAHAAGTAEPDRPASLRTGYVVLAPSVARGSDAAARRVLVHEANHLAQLALTPAARLNLTWLREATANWAALAVDRSPSATPVPGLTPYLANTAAPLDCEATDPCNASNIDQGGYGRWHVLAQLEAAYGPGLVRAWWDEIARQPSWPRGVEIAALGAVLGARGATLGQGFTALARGNLAGLDLPSTAGVRPKAHLELALTGAPAAVQPAVDHLAIVHVGLSEERCRTGRLLLEVDVPAVAGTAAVFWQAGDVPVVLAAGKADLPWRGCRPALLALPNGSATADGLPFAVRAAFVPAAVTGLRVRRRVAVFSANAAVPVRVLVQRRTGGRWTAAGTVRRRAAPGVNRVSLARLLATPGRYRVSATPAGGRTVRVILAVVGPAR